MILLIYYILTALMLISVILLENNAKKIIFWFLIITITSFIGYLVYLIFFSDKGFVKKRLLIKEREDNIYKDLIKYKLNNENAKCDLINFCKKVYNNNFSTNNNLEIIDKGDTFNNALMDNIENAKNYIIIDTKHFLDGMNKEALVSSLIEKKKMGVDIRIIYSNIVLRDKKYFKLLKNNGIKVNKFSNNTYSNGYYKNIKNIISIDGAVAYLYSSSAKITQKKKNIECCELYYKLRGDIVESVDIEAHTDATYSTKKFVNITSYPKHTINNDIECQYIGSSLNNSLLRLILKAIIIAKKSITIHVDKFIPNDAILEAIKLAIKSDIEVKIMISNVNHIYGYYTSRSYVKELAREGATSYFYDGHINSNYIIIDEDTTLVGSISLVNRSLECDLQDVLLISDKKTAKLFLNRFADEINNSYKLSNPKRVLFREHFFRKFM